MFVELMERLAALGEDVSYSMEDDGQLVRVFVKDFEGYDAHYSEIWRDYDEDAVESFIDWLRASCSAFSGEYYVNYAFEGFSVRLGYASFDI